MPAPLPIAALDVGSNTVRLLVARPVPGRFPDRLLASLETTRLGANLVPGGFLDAAAARRTLEALGRFASEIRRREAQWVVAVGTAALREAGDAEDFIEEARRQTGILLTVAPQQTEARLTLLGAGGVLGETTGLALADIGGRSTEIIVRTDAGEVRYAGFGLGVVALGERFLEHDPPTAEEMESLRRHARETLRAGGAGKLLPRGLPLAGTAGTFTTLAALDAELGVYDPRRINGHRLVRERLERMLRRLGSLDAAGRGRVPGMPPDRIGVILPGLLLALEVMGSVQRDELVVSDAGLLEGVLRAGSLNEPWLRKTRIG